jgi:hypothetical protein
LDAAGATGVGTGVVEATGPTSEASIFRPRECRNASIRERSVSVEIPAAGVRVETV